MSTPAASAPYGGDPSTIENRKVPLRRANVAYRSREYLSDKEVIPSYIRGDGHVIDLDAIVAGGVGLTEFSGIWAYSPNNIKQEFLRLELHTGVDVRRRQPFGNTGFGLSSAL